MMKSKNNPKKAINDKKQNLFTRLDTVLKTAQEAEHNATEYAKEVKKHLTSAKKLHKSTINLNRRVDQRMNRIKEVLDRKDEIDSNIVGDMHEIERIKQTIKHNFSLAESKVAFMEGLLQPQPHQSNQKSYTPYYIAAAATVVGIGCLAAMIVSSNDSNNYNNAIKINSYPSLPY